MTISTVYTGGQPFGSGLRNARLTDPVLLETLQTYKRRIARSYRALPPSRLSEVAAATMWVTRKIDGETWFLVRQGGSIFLSSPSGRVLAGDIPALKQAADLPEDSILAGELHALVDGRRERVGDLTAALSDDSAQAGGGIAFTVFDGVRLAGQPLPIAYDERLQALSKWLPNASHLRVIEVFSLRTGREVLDYFESQIVPVGGEGIVLRHAGGIIYKVKPEITIDAVVVGYTVRADQPNACRSLLLSLMRPDGQFVIIGACGNVGDDAQRRDWLGRLKPLDVPSTFRRASDSGGLYKFVQPQFVVEFSVTDLQSEHSDGRVCVAQVANFSGGAWALVGSLASPSLIHPVIRRLREDKEASLTGVRFAQFEEYLSAQPDQPSDKIPDLPPSNLLRREVWTKTSKGQLAVRKLVVWETNKPRASSHYPAYVVHWTDYSAGRAQPLDREVRPATDEATAMKIAQEMIDTNIKKGWEKIEVPK